MTDVGSMNERIQLVRLETQHDARTGQPKPAPVVVAQCWAEWQQAGGQEVAGVPDRVAIVTDTFRIRYRPGVAPQMRVQHGERQLEIVAVTEVERRTWLLLKCVGAA